jgi:hypothetical protein
VNTGSGGPKPEPEHKISGWDKFKNFWAGAWNKVRGAVGLTGLPEAHVISGNDYVKDPKTGKMNFSWEQANKNNPNRAVWNGKTASEAPGK